MPAESLRVEQYQDRLIRLFGDGVRLEGINDRFVKTITLQVTDDCCLNCSYCYQTNKSHHIMSFETARKLVDSVLDDAELTNGYINSHHSIGVILEFIGGEPLMAIGLIDQVTDYFISELVRRRHPWATRYMISICSNGVLYFESKVQEYLKKNLGHLSFSISIDGNKQLHDSCRVFPDGSGSYDMAMKGVKHFTEVLGGHMGSKMTIAPQNVCYVKDAVVSLVDNGYTHINLNCVYEDVWSAGDASELYRQLKVLADYIVDNDLEDKLFLSIFKGTGAYKRTEENNWCGGDGHMLAMDWKGDLFPCLRYMESSLGDEREPYIIGNINTGIGCGEKEKCRLDCLCHLTVSSQSDKKCLDCPISAGCGWCTAYNYQTFGTVDHRAMFICQMHQARVMATAYYKNRIYCKHGDARRYEMRIPREWALLIVPADEYEMLLREAETN